MSTSKAKGKVVKQWATIGVTEAGEEISVRVPISLTVGDGAFHIPLPRYVCDFFGRSIEDNFEHGSNWVGYDSHECEVATANMDATSSLYQRIVRLYAEKVKNRDRRKVIVVTFKATAAGNREMNGIKVGSVMDHRIATISFATGPALELTHQILWEASGALYAIRSGGGMSWVMRDPTPAPDFKGARSTFVLPWTEEREQFFVNARNNMDRLIEMIAHMLLGDTVRNIDALITNGGGLLSLPAPQE